MNKCDSVQSIRRWLNKCIILWWMHILILSQFVCDAVSITLWLIAMIFSRVCCNGGESYLDNYLPYFFLICFTIAIVIIPNAFEITFFSVHSTIYGISIIALWPWAATMIKYISYPSVVSNGLRWPTKLNDNSRILLVCWEQIAKIMTIYHVSNHPKQGDD